jgi:hypothetical protein
MNSADMATVVAEAARRAGMRKLVPPINIIAELPDGCFPVFLYAPHPEGGRYCVEAFVYGLAGRRPRFISYRKESI